MALSYIPVERDQQFLLPPSMRDWLPSGHLVWLVLEVVDRVDTSALHARHPNDGAGRRAYDPDMLLALLLYAYCTGVRSSRQIERLCEVDVAYRVVCANLVPDHTSIARFRQAYREQAELLFIEVLKLCRAAGLTSVGVVAIDGTKMGAAASLRANRTRDQIEAEVARMFDEAEQTDAAEDARWGDRRGDELPDELSDSRRRAAHLDAAARELDRLEAQRREREEAMRQARAAAMAEAAARGAGVWGRVPAEDEVARAEATVARLHQRRADVEARAARQGQRPRGRRPGPASKLARAEERLRRARERAAHRPPPQDPPVVINITDPDSRIMRSHDSWVQGYNAQAAVNHRGVVVAATVTQDHNDVAQCQPMMADTQANLAAAGVNDPLGTFLFDAGYLSEDNLTAPGPDRLIATAKAWRLRRQAPTAGPPPPDATPVEAMEHRLRTPQAAALYAQRQHTVEPVFGTTKEQRGYRRFIQRGLDAVQAEWQLMMTAHNVLKLFHYGY